MSLSDALRAAALERARQSGHTLDGVVIEPTGVIDLREMARNAGRETDHSVKLPVIAGYLHRADREPETPLTETALWRRLRPAGSSAPVTESDPAELDLTDEIDPTLDLCFDDLEALFDEANHPWLFEPIVIDDTEPAAIDDVSPVDATLADDVGRPVAVCGHCGSFGQRDLLDRISHTEYYSCDDCGHMWQQPADD